MGQRPDELMKYFFPNVSHLSNGQWPKSLRRIRSEAWGLRYIIIRAESLMTLGTHKPVGSVGLRYVLGFFLGQFLTSQKESMKIIFTPKPFSKLKHFHQATCGDPILGGSRVPSSIQLLFLGNQFCQKTVLEH